MVPVPESEMSSTGTSTERRAPTGWRRGWSATDHPVAIEATDVSKSFRIPSHRIDSLKERAVHPFRRLAYRELHALRDVTFDVRRGEFFGIVGRNGSGKSTLLKLLAGIYKADSGRIRTAGRVAPFIELGVGFNPDLSARENVELNGVMMGLSRRDARGRLDSVLDFAELREFVDLKLKNYSSGMLVRLAFALMIQSDAEILLIDEVLAVGDASFQQKCADVFTEMRDGDRTMVLVTHDVASVDRYCHRAMMLEAGEQLYLGDPAEAGREYLKINFQQHPSSGRTRAVPDLHTRLVDAWLEDDNGERIENVAEREPIRINALIEASIDLADPQFNLRCIDSDGAAVFEHPFSFAAGDGRAQSVGAGRRIRVSGTLQNPLTPGRYRLSCWIARSREIGDLALQAVELLDFVVYGPSVHFARVVVDGDLTAAPEEPAP
jgi:ABC-2 type transport system ATP-binding protein